MGTRALIHVKDEHGDTLTTIYRQWDGHLLGHDIKNILKEKCNGMGCVAATLVAGLKTGRGSVYLYPIDCVDVDEEYTYTVWPYEDQLMLSVAGYNGSLKDYKN